MNVAPGDSLAEFEIVAVLGRGGMGVVYHARDTRLRRDVALKVLSVSSKDLSHQIARFTREAFVLAALDHPRIAKLYDHREIDGAHVLVLQLISGNTLADRIIASPLPIDDALPIFTQIASALEAAHAKGVIHRDLKPANIKIDENGDATVLDFGIAKMTDPEPQDTGSPDDTPSDPITTEGFLVGTPHYMSPEQVRGRELDVRTDIWSYGCCLFEALTARLPFSGDTVSDVMAAVLHRPPPWSELGPEVPPELVALLRQCLQKNAEQRLGSARDVRIVIEGLIERRNEEKNAGSAAGAWRPEAGAAIPGRPNWELQEHLGEGGFGEVWLAAHTKSRARRVFKFCPDIERVRGLRREVVLFRLLRESLGHRDDIAQVIDWQLGEPPYYIETEYTDSGDLRQWAQERGGIGVIPLETRLDIVAQVAGAVAAAHSVGVLHKDIKPTNILITDREAKALPQARLTDFGIGLITNRESLRESGITVTSLTEVLGTSDTSSSGAGTRMYMAPEVIEGKTATTLSDVYALGVLLYQMVIGDFTVSLAPGWERNVDDELLRDDIRLCVEGLPERRLPGAADLVQRIRTLPERRQQRDRDLRRQQAVERAVRRRRQIAAAAAICLLLAAAAATFALRESYRAARESNLRREAEIAVAVAERARDEANQNRVRAQENFQLARDAVDEFLVNVSENVLLQTPGVEPVRKQLLDSALEYYQTFIQKHADDPELQFDLATAHLRVGRINTELGNGPAELEAYINGHNLLTALVETEPNQPDYRNALADATRSLAWARYRNGKPEEAVRLGQVALQMQQALVEEHPGNQRYRALLADLLAETSQALDIAGQDEIALNMAQQSLMIYDVLDRENEASGQYALPAAAVRDLVGGYLYKAARYEDAVREYDATAAALSDLTLAEPDDLALRERYATVLNSLVLSLNETGQSARAWEVSQESDRIWQSLCEESPFVQRYDYGHAILFDVMSQTLAMLERFDDALDTGREGVVLLRALHEQNPANLEYHLRFARSLTYFANICVAADIKSEAIDPLNEASTLFDVYLGRFPAASDVRIHWANALDPLAQALFDLGRAPEAIEQQKRLIEVLNAAQGGPAMMATVTERKTDAEQRLAEWLSTATTESDD